MPKIAPENENKNLAIVFANLVQIIRHFRNDQIVEMLGFLSCVKTDQNEIAWYSGIAGTHLP